MRPANHEGDHQRADGKRWPEGQSWRDLVAVVFAKEGIPVEVLCKHCNQPLDIPEGKLRGVHAAGRQRGMWRCDTADSGLPYGYNADPIGQPCGGACMGAES